LACFKAAWDNSLTEKNILSSWAKTGIWPYNPSVVLSVITPPRPLTPPQAQAGDIATPYTAKGMRKFSKVHAKNPTKEAFRKLTKANESNAARASVAEYRAEALKEALKMEKKKRTRGKKLNLSGEEAGRAQFFGTIEVKAAQSRLDEKEAKVVQEKLDKEKRKEEKAVAKAVNEALEKQEKIRKAEQKEIDAQVKADLRKQGVLDRAATRKEAAAAKKAAKKAKPSRIVILSVGSSIRASLGSSEEVEVEKLDTEAVVVEQTTKSGREIKLPQRFKK
jgi:hypothetical protein